MRLSHPGLIDRSEALSFRFDGQDLSGFRGDTLASALMANDVSLLGRSFKYHRPRGLWSAGSEEPNALVRVGTEPNVRATVQELHEALEAGAQNAWPSRRWDLLAINDLLSPFIGTGFYYKTFMWPRAFWERLYEPMIRRAAGLGRLSGRAPDAPYEKANAFCDLLVIGAGPAGLMTTLLAGRSGLDVILADEDFLMGGRLNAMREEVSDMPGARWAEDVLAELALMENVRLMPRTTVTGVYDGGIFGALERVSHHLDQVAQHCPRETFWRIAAKRSVLATGAIERPIAFRDNDRPGILSGAALRAYVNRWAVCPGASVAIFTSSDEGHRAAGDLLAAGVEVRAVIDPRSEVAARGDYPLFAGARVVGTRGRRALREITVEGPEGVERIAVDCLAVSGGWNPALHLTCHTGARPVWREEIAGFVPAKGSVAGMITVGACNGSYSTAACLAEGAEAARTIASDLGYGPARLILPAASEDAGRAQAVWHIPGPGRAWLDFQNDVTVKDVEQSAQENFRSVEHMKRYTTLGMATDQGKTANVGAMAILADATGRTIPQTGTTTFRPPYTPIALAALGAGARGKGFAPERITTSHASSVARGATMIEAGLWYRPSHFPKPGETHWREACDREIGYVRETVGIADVSTLGKIDIQGHDAAAFLDFVYANRFASLPVGRVRYGVMLREDGHVMDDGTTARLGDTRYLMTTTTAAAGQVMTHLEFVRQVLRPDLDVQIAAVTDHWAQFAIAGPEARDLLDDLLDEPLEPGDWPFMACGAVTLGGVAGRLFRISFSGEHAYELAVPTRYGAALFDLLIKRAEALGGGPYGMEALNILRIEKGFLTHSEIDGRVTAFDIGMGHLLKAEKDFVGKRMGLRPGLVDPGRARLVGLKPTGAVKQLTAGAHLFAPDAPATRLNTQGYVTSAGYSPTLEHSVALGFLQRGPERIGEGMRMVDHLRGFEAEVEICALPFYDPEGGRMRG